MCIETRYYDDEKVVAKLHKGFAYPHLDGDLSKCNIYIESINSHPEMKVRPTAESPQEYDYESLEEWFEENFIEIEIDDVAPLVLTLESGEWVDITKFIFSKC